jgi:hypothetical protein
MRTDEGVGGGDAEAVLESSSPNQPNIGEEVAVVKQILRENDHNDHSSERGKCTATKVDCPIAASNCVQRGAGRDTSTDADLGDIFKTGEGEGVVDDVL